MAIKFLFAPLFRSYCQWSGVRASPHGVVLCCIVLCCVVLLWSGVEWSGHDLPAYCFHVENVKEIKEVVRENVKEIKERCSSYGQHEKSYKHHGELLRFKHVSFGDIVFKLIDAACPVAFVHSVFFVFMNACEMIYNI